MRGLGSGSVPGRIGLVVAAFGLAVAGVVVVTDGERFSGPPPAVALAPAAQIGCHAAGPYRPPDTDSTGVPAGLTLCHGGPITIVDAGAVVDGWDISGGIVVDAPDVLVRRSRIIGDGVVPYGIRTTSAGSVRIEDTTLTGDFPEAAVGDDNWTGIRVEVTGVTHDGVRLGDQARLRNSRLHDFAPAPGVAAHGVVVRGSGGDVRLEDSQIEIGPTAASAVWVAPTGAGDGSDDPVVIRGNVLGGGRYTVHEDPTAGGPTDVLITGNRFERAAGTVPMRVSTAAVVADNTFMDGGLLPGR